MPGAAPWVEGVLPGEGEVWPAVRESCLGPAGGDPEVYALVRRSGKILAIPGRRPRLSEDPAAGTENGGVAGGPGEEPAPSLDLDGLYLTLGLQ